MSQHLKNAKSNLLTASFMGSLAAANTTVLVNSLATKGHLGPLDTIPAAALAVTFGSAIYNVGAAALDVVQHFKPAEYEQPAMVSAPQSQGPQ